MYHSLSLIQDLQEIENTMEEEEEKLHYTTLNYKMKMKLLLKLCIYSTLEPKGVFIGTREEGGQGTNPGPKRRARRDRTAAETRPKPHFRGHQVVARAALRVARSLVCPLSVPEPGFGFAAPGFDEISLLGQWLS